MVEIVLIAIQGVYISDVRYIRGVITYRSLVPLGLMTYLIEGSKPGEEAIYKLVVRYI